MPIPNSDFDPKKALVILLGAEEWPGCKTIAGDDFPLGEENPFRRSVDSIEEYFTKNLNIETANLESWFNSKLASNNILDEMTKFLDTKIQDTQATDLFFYYVGHGVKLDSNFYLLLCNSKQDFDYTYFAVHSLISVLKKTAINLRCYIILDACFSGTVAKTLSSTTNIGLFHSSYDKEISRILEDKSITLFTKALLDVLKGNCDQDYPSYLKLLSFPNIKPLVNDTMKQIHGDERVATAGFFCNSGVVDNLKIFHNPKYDSSSSPPPLPPSPPKDTREITWHIITGAKGGVGKTLLSLFLMTYYTNNRKKPLIIDFNGVNTDLKRLVNDEVGFGNQNHLSIPIDDNILIIAKGSQRIHGSLIGWMTNPYKMYNYKSFFKFLSVLRKGLLEKEKDIIRIFGYTKTDLNTIIIDTNYHFANLFSRKESDYNEETFNKNDHFSIWFIWVYRQILNSYQQQSQQNNFFKEIQFNGDINLMRVIADTIEQKIGQAHTPFIHVINPMSLSETSAIGEIFKVISGLITRGNVIPELDRLYQLKASESLRFGDLLELMNEAQQNAFEKEQQFSFSSMLKALNSSLKEDSSFKQGNQRPNNLFPISIYEEELSAYHDKLPNIVKLKVYDVFKSLFETLCSIHNSKE